MAESRDLDVETLRLIVAVEETGSLSAAAARRGVSQPAASARVREFEARWRLSLVNRGPRGSELTTDGRAATAWARSVLHEVDTMRAAMESLASRRSGHVEVAASLTIAEFILPRWLAEFRGRMETVHPRLHVVNSDRVAEMVRAEQADLGFIETAVRPEDLVCQVVGSDRLVVVVHRDHPWARRSTPLGAEMLADAEWILREPGSGTRSTFERALRQEPRCALEAGSTTALVGAVQANLGPAVVSARAVGADLESGRLVQVATELDLSRPLTAVWRRDQRMGEATAALLAVAAAGARRPPT